MRPGRVRWASRDLVLPLRTWERVFFARPEILAFEGGHGRTVDRLRERVTIARFFAIYDAADRIRDQQPIRQVWRTPMSEHDDGMIIGPPLVSQADQTEIIIASPRQRREPHIDTVDVSRMCWCDNASFPSRFKHSSYR